MIDTYERLIQQVRDWLDDGCAAGWVSEAARERFNAIETATPDALFVASEARPLVVALFGGTGVGKSSLLNRLAGADIARAGVERPTSRDVTLYVHEAVQLAALPTELPIAETTVQRHANEAWREIVWLDAPDIDSAVESNREKTLAWLRHVDLLMYVVSPERYRDDVGWRVLQRRGERHGWLFVMNRWDEGEVAQRDDFLGQLRRSGFDDPLLACTSCASPGATLPSPDEFDSIATALHALVESHGARELSRLGLRARAQEMRESLDAARAALGARADWTAVQTVLQQRWQDVRVALLEGMEYVMRGVAARFAVRNDDLLADLKRLTGRAPASEQRPDTDELAHLTAPLWDDWAATKLEACLAHVEVALRDRQLAAEACKQRWEAPLRSVGDVIQRSLQDTLRAALAQPGTRLQRLGRRVTGFLTMVLPVAALVWVALVTVQRFQQGALGTGEFLGTNFLINAALLVLVAWGVPFTFDRMLRPSLERSAYQALREGLDAGLTVAGQSVADALEQAADDAGRRADVGGTLASELTTLAKQPVQAQQPAIGRVLVGKPRGDEPVRRAAPTPNPA